MTCGSSGRVELRQGCPLILTRVPLTGTATATCTRPSFCRSVPRENQAACGCSPGRVMPRQGGAHEGNGHLPYVCESLTVCKRPIGKASSDRRRPWKGRFPPLPRRKTGERIG